VDAFVPAGHVSPHRRKCGLRNNCGHSRTIFPPWPWTNLVSDLVRLSRQPRAQSDNTRTVAVMELLHELSAEHQVILFPQEDEVAEWAQRHIDPNRDKIIQLAAP